MGKIKDLDIRPKKPLEGVAYCTCGHGFNSHNVNTGKCIACDCQEFEFEFEGGRKIVYPRISTKMRNFSIND